MSATDRQFKFLEQLPDIIAKRAQSNLHPNCVCHNVKYVLPRHKGQQNI
ncbi:hypothetical protein HMPREF3232_00793 [Fannyhessea vaginae]|nr:hypothetical protein HMPREF3232_00793 [Fannyhessea vaginae]